MAWLSCLRATRHWKLQEDDLEQSTARRRPTKRPGQVHVKASSRMSGGTGRDDASLPLSATILPKPHVNSNALPSRHSLSELPLATRSSLASLASNMPGRLPKEADLPVDVTCSIIPRKRFSVDLRLNIPCCQLRYHRTALPHSTLHPFQDSIPSPGSLTVTLDSCVVTAADQRPRAPTWHRR